MINLIMTIISSNQHLILLIESLTRDWTFMRLFSAESVVYATIWIDTHELVRQLTVADFAHAFVANHEVRLLELVGFDLGVDLLLFGE